MQIVCFAGIYMKLGDLMSMFSLNAGDSQSMGRRIFRRPYLFMRHRARRMEHRIARAVSAGGISGGVAGAVAGSAVANKRAERKNTASKENRGNTTSSMGQRAGSKVGAVLDTKNKVKDKANAVKENIKDMPTQTAYAVYSASDVCNIGFYGGEPLLKINLIKECVAYVKERYPFRQPTYNITTNATLIEEKIAIFLIENNFKITISLDGPYREQNKYRVDRKGNASYKNVYRGIEILYQKDPRYFKGNVNHNVVMYNGINRKLLESLEYLWKSDVTLIDLFETEYFKKSRDKSDEESVDEKIDEKNFDIVYRNLLLNMKKYQNAFNESDVNKTIFPGGFCVPGVRKNFITADGKIIICEKVDERQELFRIGDIYNGIDMERVNKLMNETEKRLSKCKYCWAARFCNICFMDVLSMKQEYCDQSKENIEKELGYYISRISPDRELVNYIANISLI